MVRIIILVLLLTSCTTVSNEHPTFGKEVSAPQGWIDYCNRLNTKDVDCK